MKKTFLLMLSVLTLTAFAIVPSARAESKTEPWPGVTRKVLVENEHVTIAEVTFAPGAVAVWHSHPNHTLYAVTDIKLKIEEKGKDNQIVEMKAGEAAYMPAVTHQTTNVGTKPFTGIVTEMK